MGSKADSCRLKSVESDGLGASLKRFQLRFEEQGRSLFS